MKIINKCTSIKSIDKATGDKTYAVAHMIFNEISFVGYNIQSLSSRKQIQEHLPSTVLIDNKVREVGFTNTERFYQKMCKLGKMQCLILQAIKQ